METKYSEIKDGCRFIFSGQTFTKAAPNKAFDGEGIDHVFDDVVIVEAIIDQSKPIRKKSRARMIPVRHVMDGTNKRR